MSSRCQTLTLTHSCVVFSSGWDTLKVTSLMHSPQGYMYICRTEWFLVFSHKIEWFIWFWPFDSHWKTAPSKLVIPNLFGFKGPQSCMSEGCVSHNDKTVLIFWLSTFAHAQCSNNNKRKILSWFFLVFDNFCKMQGSADFENVGPAFSIVIHYYPGYL